MKRIIPIFVMAVMLSPGLSLGEMPLNLGGYKLGEDIAKYEDQVNMDSCLQVRYMEYVQEAEIRQTAGFKSGLIGFGTCDQPNKLIRIKLKYTDASKRFYNQLLKKYKVKFGDPDEWRGDPFHIVIAWKWSFEDVDGRRISLILQHNTKDSEEKLGNSVKMTLTSQMEKEQACFEKKRTVSREASAPGPGKAPGKQDWKLFIPF
ncbi:MAG: hypothetical protein HKM93_12935 [Desulfobacteraceae bacterium]|nr:hypothetical protein [Desulfobacteraceae bacterium]